jgi:uncharacterized protein YndB with AHSA1/START domain
MTSTAEFNLDRVFDAPIDLVQQVWSDPKLLARWYGAGFETVIHKYELTRGGEWLNELKWGERSDFSKMVFQDVALGRKLVWIQSPTDSEWKTSASSMMPDWPKEVLNTVSFEENSGKTNVSLTMTPVAASKAEMDCFAEAIPAVSACFNTGFGNIDELLIKLQSSPINRDPSSVFALNSAGTARADFN